MAGEFIADSIFDNGLTYADTNGETLYITSAAATTYAQAATSLSLGQKTSVTVSVPQAPTAGTGRAVEIAAITDGVVDGSGSASHWALCKDSATSELLATGPLTTQQTVTSGNTFTLDAIEIIIRDATVT